MAGLLNLGEVVPDNDLLDVLAPLRESSNALRISLILTFLSPFIACSHLFMDLLAATGLNPHVAFGIDLIKNNELSVLDAERFYAKLHMNLKEVSPAIIKEIAVSTSLEL